MPPTPIYIVTYGGTQFPGYVQGDPEALAFRHTPQNILNRNGGTITPHGTDLRRVSLQFIVLTRLATASTDLQHLNDCKDQYRVAMHIVANATGTAALKIGTTDRYLMAYPVGISAEFQAGTSRSLRYTVEFVAEPYYVSTTPISDSFSGNSTVTLTMPDTLTTYPIFTVPSGVTAFTATHAASGKVVTFLRDTVTGEVKIDCGTFTVVKTSGGTDASVTMQTVNFGIRHTTGAGSFAIVITGYAGSGSVTVAASPRYAI
jgi:hypothetical protein